MEKGREREREREKEKEKLGRREGVRERKKSGEVACECSGEY